MFMPVQVNSSTVHNAYVESITNHQDKPVWQEAGLTLKKNIVQKKMLKTCTPSPYFMAICFMSFCFNTPCKFMPLLTLCSLLFSV
jgi:hypothetical protein